MVKKSDVVAGVAVAGLTGLGLYLYLRSKKVSAVSTPTPTPIPSTPTPTSPTPITTYTPPFTIPVPTVTLPPTPTYTIPISFPSPTLPITTPITSTPTPTPTITAPYIKVTNTGGYSYESQIFLNGNTSVQFGPTYELTIEAFNLQPYEVLSVVAATSSSIANNNRVYFQCTNANSSGYAKIVMDLPNIYTDYQFFISARDPNLRNIVVYGSPSANWIPASGLFAVVTIPPVYPYVTVENPSTWPQYLVTPGMTLNTPSQLFVLTTNIFNAPPNGTVYAKTILNCPVIGVYQETYTLNVDEYGLVSECSTSNVSNGSSIQLACQTSNYWVEYYIPGTNDTMIIYNGTVPTPTPTATPTPTPTTPAQTYVVVTNLTDGQSVTLNSNNTMSFLTDGTQFKFQLYNGEPNYNYAIYGSYPCKYSSTTYYVNATLTTDSSGYGEVTVNLQCLPGQYTMSIYGPGIPPGGFTVYYKPLASISPL
ncbi:MAG: hypothetical protein QXX23_07480 [Thermoplasmata archaeon]